MEGSSIFFFKEIKTEGKMYIKNIGELKQRKEMR